MVSHTYQYCNVSVPYCSLLVRNRQLGVYFIYWLKKDWNLIIVLDIQFPCTCRPNIYMYLINPLPPIVAFWLHSCAPPIVAFWEHFYIRTCLRLVVQLVLLMSWKKKWGVLYSFWWHISSLVF